MGTKSNAPEVAASLRALPVAVAARVERVVVEHGALLQAAVKRRANTPRTAHRPGAPGGKDGPRLLTGDYNRSISRQTTVTRTRARAEVGTNKPQGRRLELGFHGTDSLGRRYEQRAYPHFGPALAEVAPKFRRAVAAAAQPHPGDR